MRRVFWRGGAGVVFELKGIVIEVILGRGRIFDLDFFVVE